MTSYLLNFVVYTCAMVGMIFAALFIYKKFAITQNKSSQSNFLEAEDCLSIGVRKQLYVIRAGEERFLIATDAERTTMLAKLDGKKGANAGKKSEINDYLKTDYETEKFSNEMDNLYSDYRLHGADTSEVLRNIISTGERFNG